MRHGHWITIDLGKRQLNVCARCSGTILGFLSLSVLAQTGDLAYFTSIPLQQQLLLCILLALPAGLDWLIQTYGLRESTNALRGTTGFLEGGAVALLSMATVSLEFKFAVILFVGGLILMLGLVGKRLLRG